MVKKKKKKPLMVKDKPQAESIVSDSVTVVNLTLEILPRESQKRHRKLHILVTDFNIFFSQATGVKQKESVMI